jgi:hypothetical protein
MTAEEFTVTYNIQGIDRSIRTSQSLLLTLNAVRLSVVDIQRVMSGPTMANILWTGIQLTRVYTNLLRTIRRIQGAQALVGAQTTLQFGAGGALTAAGPGGFGALFGAAAAFAAANPLVTGTLVASIIASSILVSIRNNETRQRRRIQERSRAAAKAQGLEF